MFMYTSFFFFSLIIKVGVLRGPVLKRVVKKGICVMVSGILTTYKSILPLNTAKVAMKTQVVNYMLTLGLLTLAKFDR